jgi:hypothetical protein
MKIVKIISIFICSVFGFSAAINAQPAVKETANWKRFMLGKQTFELHNVTGEIIKFQGKKVLK